MPDAPDLVLYWRPGCPFCLKLKVKLRVAGIGYRPVNIHEDAEAAAVVRSVNNGDELVPTVKVGDRFLSNPRLAEVRAALSAA